MVSRSVRLLFVVDEDEAIIGVITARDTMGERPIKLLQQRGGKHGDLMVEDVLRLLEARLGVRVILTREGDASVTPDRRAALANNNKADLFISLHANASLRRSAAGAEVFYLTLDRADEEARRVAAKDNARSKALRTWIEKNGDDEQKARWLPKVASGTVRAPKRRMVRHGPSTAHG